MASKIRPILSFIGIILLLTSISLLIQRIPQEQLKMWVSQAGIFGPVVYVLLNLATFIVAPISGTPISFIGYYLYGNNVIVLSFITASLSIIINYWIARVGGQPLVKKLAGNDGWLAIQKITASYGFKTLLLMRLFQTGLHDFISYAAGIVGLEFRRYLIYSVLAMIPGSILQYWLTSKVSGAWGYTAISWIVATVGIIIVVIITWVNKKMKAIKHDKE